MSNPTSSNHLIEPSTYLPWSVEVVTAVPNAIMRMNDNEEPRKKRKKTATVLDSSRVSTGAVCPGWICLASSKGTLYIWPTNSSSNVNTTSIPMSPPAGAKKVGVEPPKYSLTLFHPSLTSSSGSGTPKRPPLVAITPAANDAVNVYAANPTTGSVIVWKVQQEDVRLFMTNPRTVNYAQTTMDLERAHDDGDDKQQKATSSAEDEYVTSLTVLNRQLIVLGTSKGGIFCCNQTTIPLSLHSQRMSANRSSRKSIVGLFFGGDGDSHPDPNRDSSPSMFHLPIPCAQEGASEFLSISEEGSIWHWRILPTVAASHRATTEALSVTSLKELFQENHTQSTTLGRVVPLQAKCLGNRIHVLVRTMHGGDDQTSENRLYWVRLMLDNSGKKAQVSWVDAQWLNRFPAPQDVNVMGLVLCENEMSYAAFHQKSGGVGGTVIVMALSDAPDELDEESATIYEVDLPMTEVPALLPRTFTNDVVTHGVTVFARSGLGLRIRVLPPSASSAMSPRSAARSNPMAVLKLTTHLRSAFAMAYQHQDVTNSNRPTLPPSLSEASSVDIEEAAIVAATQLHHKKDGWSATTVSVNDLEYHLAFIQWLRQNGLYRSFSNYGKWRLLALGQELAAFLELVAPTLSSNSSEWEQEQFSQLDLSRGVAVWLKQQLHMVLRQQDSHHYSLWCGWFSTAMATAMTYREERANISYDIPLNSKPPMVGSNSDDNQSTKVPVWTSHPVLQDIFGDLLQHWKMQKNVQVLPPKTVEVIITTALESFADSAASLNSERATGMYAQIKAMSIPLIRTLHPPLQGVPKKEQASKDDILAFQLSVQHDYYEAICEIAHDHENKHDKAHFRLEPLLQSSTQCQSTDYESGLSFGQFVLQWYSSRGLFGHTILYGRQCPEQDLNYILRNEERLRQYQWIQAIHRGDFDSAATSLLSQSDKSHQVTLSQTKLSLSLAKLANNVVLKESQSQQAAGESREQTIDNRLELVGVQKELLGDGESHSEEHLWSANRLLSLALDKADQTISSTSAKPKEDAIRYCYLGLLTCLTYENKDNQRRNAAQVWAKSIEVDWDSLWKDWFRSSNNLSSTVLAETVLDNTVFGGLLRECSDDQEAFAPVTYSSQMEYDILDRLGLSGSQGADALRRLLYNVATTFKDTETQEGEEGEPMEEDAIMVA